MTLPYKKRKGYLDMLEYLKAIFFGIVEGITEWLPVSSTGHLILLDEFVKLDVGASFFEMFEVVISSPFGLEAGVRRARGGVWAVLRRRLPLPRQ